jgi:hypothetical protein
MRTLEFDVLVSTLSEELPEPDLNYFQPTCEIKWAYKKDFPDIKQDYPFNIILVQKYVCRFSEKSWDPIWVPVGFLSSER